MPKAMSIVWDMLKSVDLDESTKLVTMLKFDEILGLNIEENIGIEIPGKVQDLARTRAEYRKNNIWDKADLVRKQIEDLGYIIEDIGDDYKLKKKF